MASFFEEMGGSYALGAEVMYYPNLELPEEETSRYGEYGKMRHTYPPEHLFFVFSHNVRHPTDL